MALALLGGLAALGYAVTKPVPEKFTEFYMLGVSGKATDYPKELSVGEEGKVIVGVVNREYEPVSYKIEVVVNGVKSKEIGPIMLEHGNEWKEVVGFTPDRTVGTQKVEFLLYKQGRSEVYKSLHLWIKVR